MATRLPYLFWGTMPDEQLRAAAQAGEDHPAPRRRTMRARPNRATVRPRYADLLPAR